MKCCSLLLISALILTNCVLPTMAQSFEDKASALTNELNALWQKRLKTPTTEFQDSLYAGDVEAVRSINERFPSLKLVNKPFTDKKGHAHSRPICVAIENGDMAMFEYIHPKLTELYQAKFCTRENWDDYFCEGTSSLGLWIQPTCPYGADEQADIFELAVIRGQIDIVKKLFSLDPVTFSKKSDLFFQVARLHKDAAFLKQIIPILLDAGLDYQKQTYGNYTFWSYRDGGNYDVLYLAAKEGNTNFISVLHDELTKRSSTPVISNVSMRIFDKNEDLSSIKNSKEAKLLEKYGIRLNVGSYLSSPSSWEED